MRETNTRTINQNATKVLHLFNLETDDLAVKMVLTENVRFYEHEIIDDRPNVSHEVSAKKDKKGKVINGTYKECHGKVWCELEAMPKTLCSCSKKSIIFRSLLLINKTCNIAVSFQRCCLVDMTSRCGSTSNQRFVFQRWYERL